MSESEKPRFRVIPGGEQGTARDVDDGTLIRCPFCGSQTQIELIQNSIYRKNRVRRGDKFLACGQCFAEGRIHDLT